MSHKAFAVSTVQGTIENDDVAAVDMVWEGQEKKSGGLVRKGTPQT